MICPNCSYNNPAESKFCENCGNALERTCPNCGKTVAPNTKFCRNCGFAIAGTPTSAPRLADLQKSAPNAPQEKIRAASAQMAGERKLVTVLFTDIVGSTALAEALDPEDWSEIISGAHQRVSAAVYRYEGTIAQLLGDGVLAFFGAPITHEDDAERAVSAALDIQSAIHEFAHELRARKSIEHFRMRVGLNTGLVVVGNVGSDLHVEYLAVGDTVNLAARMQSAAEPNTILISANTARAVKHAFELEARGALELKGKREPVAAFRVVARKAVAASARGLAGLDSPLVGREREMQTIQAHIAELKQGRGHILALMGDAGLGKSRLIAEVRKQYSESSIQNPESNLQPAIRNLNWFKGRSLSYETNTPYAPFIDLLAKFFDLRREDSDADKYIKIKARAGEHAPFLATLVGVKPANEDAERVQYLEPPQLRGAIFHAVTDLIERTANATPLVLVFEDLHWADATSLDLLEQILPLAERAPLLLIAAFRPQRQEPSWRFHETALRDYAHCYTSITLEPLDETQSRALVANLLHIEDLPEKVRALILKKAEGNPFFVEEVIRSLLDTKLVVRDDGHWRATREIENISIPDTLAGVITARLDRLDDAAKHTAQTASVIGREFQRGVLVEISDAPNALDDAMVNLQRRELVREKSRVPEVTYLFKHALTQEAAYASMLLSKRRELHRRAAECLEKIDATRVYDIARHLVEAQEMARALPYLVEAGNRATREYAPQEALGYFARAVEIAQAQTETPHARRAYEGLGNALTLTQDIARALENYQAMLAYAQTHADVPMQVSAHNKLALVFMYSGDFAGVEKNLQASERLARMVNDRMGLSEMFTVRCSICTGTGDFDSAIKYLGESVQIGRELNQKEQMAYGTTHTANTLTFMTRFDEAWTQAQEAMRLSEEAGDRQHQAELLGLTFPTIHLRNGELDKARQSAGQGSIIAKRIGSPFTGMMGNWMLGMIARLRGEYQDAIQFFEQSVSAARTGLPMFLVVPLATLGATLLEVSSTFAGRMLELHTEALKLMATPMEASMGASAWADIGFCALALNNIEQANELFQKGLNYPTTLGRLYRPIHLMGAGYVALAQHQLDDAAKLVNEACEYAHARAMKHLIPDLTLALARVCAARGEPQVALIHFARVEELARPMQMRPAVMHARAGAAQVLEELGRAAEADTQREGARAMLDEMATLFRDEKLCALFEENAK